MVGWFDLLEVSPGWKHYVRLLVVPTYTTHTFILTRAVEGGPLPLSPLFVSVRGIAISDSKRERERKRAGKRGNYICVVKSKRGGFQKHKKEQRKREESRRFQGPFYDLTLLRIQNPSLCPPPFFHLRFGGKISIAAAGSIYCPATQK